MIQMGRYKKRRLSERGVVHPKGLDSTLEFGGWKKGPEVPTPGLGWAAGKQRSAE